MRLPKLARGIAKFDSACCDIRELIYRGRHAGDSLGASAHIEFAILCLHDAWTCANRWLIATSANGAVSLTGNVLNRSTVLTGVVDPIDFLRTKGVWSTRQKMDKNWEPDWHVPSTAIRAATLLNVSNLVQITSGIGSTLSHEPLRWTRNVVAHSLPATWARFIAIQKSAGFSGKFRPAEFVLLRGGGGRGPQLIDEWIENLRLSLIVAAK